MLVDKKIYFKNYLCQEYVYQENKSNQTSVFFSIFLSFLFTRCKTALRSPYVAKIAYFNFVSSISFANLLIYLI